MRALRAPGDAALRDAHVHELRLVLRRHLGHRDDADPPVRRPRLWSSRGSSSGRRSRNAVSGDRSRRRRATCPKPATAGAIYEDSVGPAARHAAAVAAHYGVSSLFTEYAGQRAVYCYRVDREDAHRFTSGRARLALGRVRVTSTITEESDRVVFGVLHLGDHNFSGGVIPFPGEAEYEALVRRSPRPSAPPT